MAIGAHRLKSPAGRGIKCRLYLTAGSFACGRAKRDMPMLLFTECLFFRPLCAFAVSRALKPWFVGGSRLPRTPGSESTAARGLPPWAPRGARSERLCPFNTCYRSTYTLAFVVNILCRGTMVACQRLSWCVRDCVPRRRLKIGTISARINPTPIGWRHFFLLMSLRVRFFVW